MTNKGKKVKSRGKGAANKTSTSERVAEIKRRFLAGEYDKGGERHNAAMDWMGGVVAKAQSEPSKSRNGRHR